MEVLLKLWTIYLAAGVKGIAGLLFALAAMGRTSRVIFTRL
jgi:hypothetical protein